MFRDYICVMFNCRELGLNLHTVALHYHNGPVGEELFYDVMAGEWDEVKSAFSDAANIEFQIYVVIRARKFAEGRIYECGILPDTMVESLRTAWVSTSMIDESDTAHSLDKAKKFVSPQQQRLWYSGHDVTTELGRRQWQKQLVPKFLAGFDIGESVPMEIPRGLNGTQAEKENLQEALTQAQRDAEDQITHTVRQTYQHMT
ncbi:hypothetical protein PCG10_009773 [Penicillium crustosum]|uniref:Uncharacterized protein n=1 Tax=Penicillium crustosum TaxID=36656 RepID=A0A9P5GFK6_PENCR|nr:hypothetical protein PCG10_009773 [Penicillium crustosum]